MYSLEIFVSFNDNLMSVSSGEYVQICLSFFFFFDGYMFYRQDTP